MRRVSVGRERCVFVVYALLRQRQLQLRPRRSKRILASYAHCNIRKKNIRSLRGTTRQILPDGRFATPAASRRRILANCADCNSLRESIHWPCGTIRRTPPNEPCATNVVWRCILATCADCNRPKRNIRRPCGTIRRWILDVPSARNAVNRSVATQIAIANVTLCIGCSIRKPWRNETTGIA